MGDPRKLSNSPQWPKPSTYILFLAKTTEDVGGGLAVMGGD